MPQEIPDGPVLFTPEEWKEIRAQQDDCGLEPVNYVFPMTEADQAAHEEIVDRMGEVDLAPLAQRRALNEALPRVSTEAAISLLRETRLAVRGRAVADAEGPKQRENALRRLMSGLGRRFAKGRDWRYRGGRPANERAHRRARDAFVTEMKKASKVEAALAAAMEASGFTSRGYVQDLRKRERWDDDL